jgi:hypothetical protein
MGVPMAADRSWWRNCHKPPVVAACMGSSFGAVSAARTAQPYPPEVKTGIKDVQYSATALYDPSLN